jgi:hypothetical protein
MRGNPQNSLEIPRALRCVNPSIMVAVLGARGAGSVRGSRSILQGAHVRTDAAALSPLKGSSIVSP